MALKTKIRVGQITGSYSTSKINDQEGVTAAGTGSLSSLSLQDALTDMASAIKRIHGEDSFIQNNAGAFKQALVPSASDGYALGSASKMWSDLFLASGAVVNFNAGDVTMTHSANEVTVAGGTLATAALTTSTIVASGIVKTDDTTEATTATDGSLQTDGGLSVAKSAVIGDDLDLLSNAAVLKVGSDQPFTLTHANSSNTLMASSGHKLAFGHNDEHITGDGTDLSIVSSGDVKVTGDLIPSADDTYDLGTTSAAWQDLYLEGDITLTDAGAISAAAGDMTVGSAAAGVTIDAATTVKIDSDAGDISFEDGGTAQLALDMDGTGGEIIMQLKVASDDFVFKTQGGTEVFRVEDNGAFDIAGGLGSSGVTVTSAGALSADGRIVTDDATEASSTTDGSLQTDGGLSVAKSAVIGDNLLLMSDSARLALGAGGDVRIDHDGSTGVSIGLKAAGTIAIGANNATSVTLGRTGQTVTVNGNLDVNGATTTVDSVNMTIQDSIIGLGVSGSGAYSTTGERGILFTRGAASAVQAGLWYDGTRFQLGTSPTSPASASFGTVPTNGYSSLMFKKAEFANTNNHISVGASGLTVVAAVDIVLDPGGNNVLPGSDNADALGASGTAWSDLFLGSGAVIDFNASDITLTHGANLLTVAGGALRMGGTSKMQLGGPNDYLQLDTDVKIVAAADVEINAGGGNVKPSANDGAALGVSGTGWSDLFLASGAVVNFHAGDVTLTHSANTVTVAGGTLATAALTTSTIVASGIVKTDDATEATSTTDGSLQTDGGLSVVKSAVIGDDLDLLSDGAILSIGSTSKFVLTDQGANNCAMAASGARLAFGDAGDYITGDGTDISVISTGDIVLSAAGAQIKPASNDQCGLGVAGTAFSDLFLAEGGVINWDSGDATLTQASNVVTLAGATLTATLTNALGAAAGGGVGMTSYNSSAAVADLALDLDGMTDIGAALADADLIAVDDGAGGTNRKCAMSRVVTYVQGELVQKAAMEQTSTLNANTDLNTTLGSDWTDAAIAQREVYVNGQLMWEGPNAAANKDFYAGGSAGRIKFEFALQSGDVIQCILRAG